MTRAQRAKPAAKKRGRRRPGKGALMMVTLMLAASGVIRFADGPGLVLAEEVGGIVKPGGDAMPDLVSAESCEPPPDIAGVLAALDQREKRLEQRESALADRLAALNLAEAEIRRNLVALEAAEARLTDLVALSDEAAENDLLRLTAVYEAMKPKEAAALFEEMAPEFAAGFLGRMRPDIAAAIMAGLAPETAYTVSVMLAGRNANAPTQ